MLFNVDKFMKGAELIIEREKLANVVYNSC